MQDEKLKLKIFEQTTLSDLFKQIYNSTRMNKQQMKKHLQKVSQNMNTMSNISIYSGLLIQYMRTMIKNDQQVLKMTDIITGLLNKTTQIQKAQNVNQIVISQQQRKKILQGLQQQVQNLVQNKKIGNHK